MDDKRIAKLNNSELPEYLPGTIELIAQFLAEQDVLPVSKEIYGRCVRYFIDWRDANQSLVEPGRETMLAYKSYLRDERQMSAYTVNLYISVVRQFYAWAESKGYYRDITRGVKGTRKPRGFAKDALTVEQAQILLNCIDRSKLVGKRDYAVINLMLRTALRTIEVARANVGDIGQQGGEVVLWIRGKGHSAKDELAVLTPASLIPINEYLHSRGQRSDSTPLFASLSDRNYGGRLTTRSISRIVHERLIEARIATNRLSAHSLRHSAITFALLSNATVQEAQAFGRHRNVNTTMIYAHNIDRIAAAPEKRIDELLS